MHYLQVRSEHEPDDKHEGFGFHVGLLGLTQWQGGAKEQMYSGRLALGVSSRSHVARRELRTSAIISLQPGRLISCQPPASQTQITKVKVAPSFPYGVAVGTNQRRALGFAVGGAVRPQHDIRRPGLAQVLAQARCADPFVPAAAGINRGDERIARGRRPGGLEPRRPPMRGRGREIPGPVTINVAAGRPDQRKRGLDNIAGKAALDLSSRISSSPTTRWWWWPSARAGTPYA